MLNSKTVEILACPLCKGKFELLPDGNKLLCRHCNLAFPIKEGIPLLLADAAEKMKL